MALRRQELQGPIKANREPGRLVLWGASGVALRLTAATAGTRSLGAAWTVGAAAFRPWADRLSEPDG
jgi:hypothetical protein